MHAPGKTHRLREERQPQVSQGHAMHQFPVSAQGVRPVSVSALSRMMRIISSMPSLAKPPRSTPHA